jgi:sugar phosphate isomerase/epimerase
LTSRFGISTHVFHAERLAREHLAAVAARGFEALELYATRTHFDYHDPAAAVALGGWLEDTGLSLHAVHAPTTVGFSGGKWGETLSLAAGDEGRRQMAVSETVTSLGLASVVPFEHLVMHLGVPSPDAGANSRSAAARSLEEVAEAAEAVGVSLAIELIPNALSLPPRLVQWLEEDLELDRAGICLDVGHAHLAGDVMDAVETCSGHIVTTHVHDNDGRRDDHLVPGHGTIDWEGVMMAFQKVGYDGAWIFELAPAGDWRGALERAAGVRTRLERLLHQES